MNIEFDAIKAVIMGLVGWLLYSLKRLSGRVEDVPSRKEIELMINERVAGIQVRQEEAIKDLIRIEAKLDHLLDIIIRASRDRSLEEK